MALSFGVTVLPDPPYQRLVELMVSSPSSHGFEYGWTYDSHVLWQESFPMLALAADRDLDDQARPHGHEPRHARADRARERLRDAARHLGRPHGHGHRPRRLGACATSASSPSRWPSSRRASR